MYKFPFGMPIKPVFQADRSQKPIFVLGVYASAVHARWLDEDGSVIINALAVASEPEIFWRGDNAGDIVAKINVPPGAGRLVPASKTLNGPSGIALNDMFLTPLGIDRSKAWLCDLLPESRCNPNQAAALQREYLPRMAHLGLDAYDFPPVPKELASTVRIAEIEREMLEACSSVLVTLGDQPLKWFASRYGAYPTLNAYGKTDGEYGRLHDIEIGGRSMKLLPLVHPRQASRLGSHSPVWSGLHRKWILNTAPSVLTSIAI